MASQNRVFLGVTIGLVSLLAIGLISIAVWRYSKPSQSLTQAPPVTAAEEMTSTFAPAATEAATSAPTPMPTRKPTSTPVVVQLTPATPTREPVVSAVGGAEATAQGGETPQPTSTPPEPTETPQTGLGLAVVALAGLGLGGVLVAARRLRSRT